MLRNTHKKNEICSHRLINLNNSILERKSHENKMENLKKSSRLLNFAVLKKICNFPGIYICG